MSMTTFMLDLIDSISELEGECLVTVFEENTPLFDDSCLSIIFYQQVLFVLIRFKCQIYQDLQFLLPQAEL